MGNLAEGVTDSELLSLFGVFGPVRGGAVALDASGRSRHFAFLEMDAAPAAAAVAALHRQALRGRELFVQVSAGRRHDDAPTA